MDLAYDYIAESNLRRDGNDEATSTTDKKTEPQASLNEDIQEAYRAISNSPWGSWLGGQVGNVVKQVSLGFALPFGFDISIFMSRESKVQVEYNLLKRHTI
jgi:hypothetical protein